MTAESTGIPRESLPHEHGTFHPELACYVLAVMYDAPTKTGVLRLESGSCVDMTGAIDLFTGIDPRVVSIYTFQGAEVRDEPDIPDTAYFRASPATDWYAVAEDVMQERPPTHLAGLSIYACRPNANPTEH